MPSTVVSPRKRFYSGRILLALALSLSACGEPEPTKGPYDTDPLTPEQAAEAFQIEPGFRVEVVAAEPQITDPVDIAFDENGNLWVAEMLDYPFNPAEGEKPRSRIRFLQDEDGDGCYETATVFADNLMHVSTVQPWKGGVLSAAAPDIFFFKDTDGDHKADIKEVWFTGFETKVSPEARVNSLRYGIDNWIYAANAGRAGTITSPKHPDKPGVVIRGHDFRFHPGTGDWKPAAGSVQYGMSFDEWGNRFGSKNTVFLSHVVMPAKYVLRNRFFSPGSAMQFLAQHDDAENVIYPLTQPQQWRIERTQARQKRYEETNPGRVEHLWGRFSAATGATVYVGDSFPPDHVGNVFVGEVNGNLVRRNILTQDGATFRTHRAPEAEREFLAIKDSWFSPTNFVNAPDGNLYMVDFYREYVEEPLSIPTALQDKLQMDFSRGSDMGRIYRIVPQNGGTGRSLKSGLGEASTADLVAALEHANGWHRRTAHRLLVEKQDQAAVPLLKTMASESESPQGRLHALWVLEGLGALDAAMVRSALSDEHPRIRENAIKMAEAFLPELARVLMARRNDDDPQARFQFILTLGLLPGNHRTLAPLMAEYGDDKWFRDALLSSVGNGGMNILNRLLTRHRAFFDEPTDGKRELLTELTALIGAHRNSREISLFLITVDGSPHMKTAAWRSAALTGLARGLAIDGSRGFRIPSAAQVAMKYVRSSVPEVRDAAREAASFLHLPGYVRQSLQEVAKAALSIEERARAAEALRGGSYANVAPALRELLTTAAPQALQEAAAGTLSTFDDDGVGEVLLSGWSGYGPTVRQRVAQAMMRRRDRAAAFLNAIASNQVPVETVDAVSRIRLTQYPDEELRAQAEKLLAAAVSDRADVVAAYEDVAALKGDLDHGRTVFEESCAKCHQPRGERARIGPNLSGVNNKTRTELLKSILDPSSDIQPNYANYVVVDKVGRIYDGLLAGETAEAIRLRGEYEDQTILRKNISEMRTSTVSLMPDGLEEDMSKQDLANVIEYLRAGL
jgi:putative membrane-bound dehydrogenase-like protein